MEFVAVRTIDELGVLSYRQKQEKPKAGTEVPSYCISALDSDFSSTGFLSARFLMCNQGDTAP